jgi:hypothetical protein
MAISPDAVKAARVVSTGSKPSPYPRVFVPSAEAVAQEVTRQTKLKLTENQRFLGCGHTYEAKEEVVCREACLHHHCVDSALGEVVGREMRYTPTRST